LPKITNSPQYNNPYNPNDLTVNYFDKEEKNKYQEFKTNLSSLKNVIFFLNYFKTKKHNIYRKMKQKLL